jgi:hypothetical protein
MTHSRKSRCFRKAKGDKPPAMPVLNTCPRCNEPATDFERCPECEEAVCTDRCIAGKLVRCFECEERQQ